MWHAATSVTVPVFSKPLAQKGLNFLRTSKTSFIRK